MAIRKDVTFKGIPVNNAYIKIWKFDGNKSSISFGVGIFAPDGSQMIDSETITISYDIEGQNPIKQAYEFIKKTPKYSGGTDC